MLNGSQTSSLEERGHPVEKIRDTRKNDFGWDPLSIYPDGVFAKRRLRSMWNSCSKQNK